MLQWFVPFSQWSFPVVGRELLSLLPLKISMKQLGEVICQSGDWYHQYADGINQYRNTKVKISEIKSLTFNRLIQESHLDCSFKGSECLNGNLSSFRTCLRC